MKRGPRLYGKVLFLTLIWNTTYSTDRIGKYLLTGVIFGGVTFRIGEETGADIAGTDILLFDRKSGKAITAGSLTVKG